MILLPTNELNDFKNAPTWNIIKVGHGNDNKFHQIIQDPFGSNDTVLKTI